MACAPTLHPKMQPAFPKAPLARNSKDSYLSCERADLRVTSTWVRDKNTYIYICKGICTYLWIYILCECVPVSELSGVFKHKGHTCQYFFGFKHV